MASISHPMGFAGRREAMSARDPVFRVVDVERAVDHYQRLGFTTDYHDETYAFARWGNLVIHLAHDDDPDAHILDRFATSLQRERQDFNGRMLTIRRSDLRVLASCMGRSLEELGARLEQLGLRAAAAT